MRILILIALVALGGCAMPPVKVTPVPEVAAVRIQNETTRKHITSFSDRNKKTREHVDKSIEAHAVEDEKLRSALRSLEELLKE